MTQASHEQAGGTPATAASIVACFEDVTKIYSMGATDVRALAGVNNDQHTAMELTQQMLTDPDSVDVHHVTIALAEATMSLEMTKAVVDAALQAYRQIISA